MSSYSFSDAAVKDIEDICEYVARQNAKVASQLFDEIRKKCKLVAGFPNMGKSYSKLAPNLRGDRNFNFNRVSIAIALFFRYF